MKRLNSFIRIFTAVVSLLYFQSFTYAINNNSTAIPSAYAESSSSDTLFLFNGKDVSNLEFVMRSNGVDVSTLYVIENTELKFPTTEVGYFRTKGNYSNFKLHAEWRWPVEIGNGNSGILIYTEQDTVWPRCIQVQLKRDAAGDIIAMNGVVAEGATGKPKDTAVKINDSNEKPLGQWNECDVLCFADSMEVYINGKFQNKVTGIKVTNGTIGFQLEGKPVEFRNIYLIKEKL